MISPGFLWRMLNKSFCSFQCGKGICTNSVNQKSKVLSNKADEAISSIWFTTLPNKVKNAMRLSPTKKVKIPVRTTRKGELLISCKNSELNHFRGTNYKKFDVIPLASKGWKHKKSKGDHFSLLPSSSHTAFLIPSDKQYLASKFSECGVSDKLLQVLHEAGIHCPTYIQAEAIPKILAGKNLLVTAETGCGKTLAYAIPMIEHVLFYKSKIEPEWNSPLGLIVVPTRELATQVYKVISNLCKNLDIKCELVLANRTKKFLTNFGPDSLEKVDIVVATLGIMCKLTYHKVYSLSKCLHLTIDEADSLLDDSFNNKLSILLKRCKFDFNKKSLEKEVAPTGAHVSFVSATMPRSLEEILEGVFPARLLEVVSTTYLHKVQPHIEQTFVRCSKSDKPTNLLSLVRQNLKNRAPVMIFSNKSSTCNWVSHFLNENNVDCVRLNSGMANEDRAEELMKFRNGTVDVMSCTDVASRGFDITRVKHIINYEFPEHMADYVHRSGRAGRIGNEMGCKITSFISSPYEVDVVQKIELAARTNSELPNVNNNITRILYHRMRKSENI